MSEILELIKSPVFAVSFIVLVAIALIAWNIINKNKRTNVKPANVTTVAAVPVPTDITCSDGEVLKDAGHPNVLLLDVRRRRRCLRYMEGIKAGKDYGRQWLFGTNLVFLLCLTADNTLYPVVPPVEMKHTPAELYEALQTKEDVEEVLGPEKEEHNGVKYGLLVAAACVALFLMFAYTRQGG